MTNEEPNSSSLLSCTVKKSKQVLWKVLKYGTYLVAGVLAIVFTFYGAMAIYETVLPWATSVCQSLITIPWYVYAGIGVIAAIPIYSSVWCIARDLTEEDWKSEAATNSASALALALAGDHTSIWYHIFRFFGAAYHHYRKRSN